MIWSQNTALSALIAKINVFVWFLYLVSSVAYIYIYMYINIVVFFIGEIIGLHSYTDDGQGKSKYTTPTVRIPYKHRSSNLCVSVVIFLQLPIEINNGHWQQLSYHQ